MAESSTVTPTIFTVSTNNPSILLVRTHKGAITKVTGDGLTGLNWVTWHICVWSLLALCEVKSYVHREITQLQKKDDLVGHDNWKNDNYAKHLITQNTGDEAIVHV